MSRPILFWTLAFVVTIVTAVVQRVTGPSYPRSGSLLFAGSIVEYRFERSHAVSSDAEVFVKTDPAVSGTLLWKRNKTNDEWTSIAMERTGEGLKAHLPAQPAAGKLQYQVRLSKEDDAMLVPAEPIIIRYRGEVPLWILLPHILAMFGAMLFSTRAGFEFFIPSPSYRNLVYWTLGFLVAGGFVLGPLMQYYAFNDWWTGWPMGTDLTDNKTALALLGWIGASVALKRSSSPGKWVLAAALIMFVVYLIPHSILGSELDYSSAPR